MGDAGSGGFGSPGGLERCPPPVCVVFSGRPVNGSSLCFQLFVIVVWNFELYMIPLALLLPLAWNYILMVSGKDTRQDVVSDVAKCLETLNQVSQMEESNLHQCCYFNSNNMNKNGQMSEKQEAQFKLCASSKHLLIKLKSTLCKL